MDKFKNLSKGGWHPSGDRPIHRDSWKSDLKGMATGKKKDPYEDARNHQSRPLASLRDPSSFAPPPKHSAYYGSNPSSPGVSGGLGAPVPTPARRPTREELAAAAEEEEAAQRPPPGPYRVDTSGLRTDNLPKPPVRRIEAGAGSPAPAPPPRVKPAVPQRSAGGPPPVLPPRQTEYPDEFAPAPPPTYGEATQPTQSAQNPDLLNQSSINRLSQAGVSVPGFGIGNSTTPTQTPSAQGHSGQLNELQQRFSRMGNTQSPPAVQPAPNPPMASWQQRQVPARTASPSLPPRSPVASPPPGPSAAAGKKPPPPPPPKKSNLIAGNALPPTPPPIPTSSKPRPS